MLSHLKWLLETGYNQLRRHSLYQATGEEALAYHQPEPLMHPNFRGLLGEIHIPNKLKLTRSKERVDSVLHVCVGKEVTETPTERR